MAADDESIVAPVITPIDLDEQLQQIEQLRANQNVARGRLAAVLVCYYYPQYNLSQAVDMARGDLNLLLDVAMLKDYERFQNQLVAAAVAMDGKTYKKIAAKNNKDIKEIRKRLRI